MGHLGQTSRIRREKCVNLLLKSGYALPGFGALFEKMAYVRFGLPLREEVDVHREDVKVTLVSLGRHMFLLQRPHVLKIVVIQHVRFNLRLDETKQGKRARPSVEQKVGEKRGGTALRVGRECSGLKGKAGVGEVTAEFGRKSLKTRGEIVHR